MGKKKGVLGSVCDQDDYSFDRKISEVFNLIWGPRKSEAFLGALRRDRR